MSLSRSLLSSSLYLAQSILLGDKERGSFLDLDTLDGLEKIDGFIPTGFSAFGVLLAIKIKKVLVILTMLLLASLSSKFFTGVWPLMGFGGHHLPYKPIFIKEEPHYEEEHHRYDRGMNVIRRNGSRILAKLADDHKSWMTKHEVSRHDKRRVVQRRVIRHDPRQENKPQPQ